MSTTLTTCDAGPRQIELVTLTTQGAVAEFVPAFGGNCVRWAPPITGELLYAPALAELAERPTRGGIPVLFPFPNRIRGGRFTWTGREYQLPCNDSTNKNAIHGFAPRLPWRVTGVGDEGQCAWVRLSFQGSIDAPECRELWPGDYLIDITWELTPTALTARTMVTNPNDQPLPFGLGFHPYFALKEGASEITVPAAARWELVDSLPTGRVIPVTPADDLRRPRAVQMLTLDDVYTQVGSTPLADGLRELGRVIPKSNVAVIVRASSDFREVVVFTPPHKKAVCIEPYTCPTDAVNLTDAGWQVLPPGGLWTGVVVFEVGS